VRQPQPDLTACRTAPLALSLIHGRQTTRTSMRCWGAWMCVQEAGSRQMVLAGAALSTSYAAGLLLCLMLTYS
jgi:hypothetical protein